MNRFGRKDKDKIQQFRTITGASDKIANDCLKSSGWSLEQAIDRFYASGFATAQVQVDSRALENLFRKYSDPSGEIILAEGISMFCEDLGVDPADIVMLVLSWHMNAATMCEYTRAEFVQGLQKLGLDSIEKLQKRLGDLRSELKDETKFKEIYKYAFMFSREKGQKCLQLDVALGMWQLVFSPQGRPWALLEDWCEFLQAHHNRAIAKDTWDQLLEFAKTIKPDFSNFDENGAWPYLLDEFVEYIQKKDES